MMWWAINDGAPIAGAIMEQLDEIAGLTMYDREVFNVRVGASEFECVRINSEDFIIRARIAGSTHYYTTQELPP